MVSEKPGHIAKQIYDYDVVLITYNQRADWAVVEKAIEILHNIIQNSHIDMSLGP